MGDRGLLLQWDFGISPENLQILLQAKERVQELLGANVEVTNTYNSLLVRYAGFLNDQERDRQLLEHSFFRGEVGMLSPSIPQRGTPEVWKIPVCYSPGFGLDLNFLAEAKKLSIQEIIDLHTGPVYTVYFIGFLPGFPYLGGMDHKLNYPRKAQPRRHVEEGAVGIAGNQTGIYPKKSPAGWQIIGNCPISLFDVSKNPVCPINAGDKIRLTAINLEKYKHIKQEVEQGRYQPQKIAEDA